MINIKREKILHKGYANLNDIKKFIPCGYDRAVEIYEEIQNDVISQGKVNLQKSILAKRLLPYVGLSEKEIFNYADKEKSDIKALTSN